MLDWFVFAELTLNYFTTIICQKNYFYALFSIDEIETYHKVNFKKFLRAYLDIKICN